MEPPEKLYAEHPPTANHLPHLERALVLRGTLRFFFIMCSFVPLCTSPRVAPSIAALLISSAASQGHLGMAVFGTSGLFAFDELYLRGVH